MTAILSGIGFNLATVVGGLATTTLSGLVMVGLGKYFHPANNPFQNTIDMTTLAEKGRFRRAHGREGKMQELIGAVQQGSAILVGPSGSGKTAQVEELTIRIINKEIPSLAGFRVIRLSLKKAKGEAGLKASLERFWTGGVENQVRYILEEIERRHGKGKSTILFIDEIQDLLGINIGMFDDFKEELARKGVRLIGATTDEHLIYQLRYRKGPGAGMGRRIQVIEIEEMTKDEAQEAVKVLLPRLAEEYQNTRQFKFLFNNEVPLAIVELAKDRYPDKIFPDAPVSFTEDLCRYYFDQNFKQKEKSIGLEEIAHYLAQVKGVHEGALKEKVNAAAKRALFRKNFRGEFFPQVEKCSTSVPLVELEAKRAQSYFEAHADEPFLILQGDSQKFLTDVVSHCIDEGQEVYRCDATKLFRQANTLEGRQLLKEWLNRLFRGKRKKPLLVIENCKPSWLGVTTAVSSATSTQGLIQQAVQTDLGRKIQDGVQQLIGPGARMGPLFENISMPYSLPLSKLPAIIDDLFKFIEEDKIPSIIPFYSEVDLKTSREKWDLLPIRTLSMPEMVKWLNERYQAQSKLPDLNNPPIFQIVLALYHLKDAMISTSILDLAAQVVDCIAAEINEIYAGTRGLIDTFQIEASAEDIQKEVENNYDSSIEHLSEIILKILGGVKSLEEINKALMDSQKQIQTSPFSVLKSHQEKKPFFEDTLNSRLHDLFASSTSAILWIQDESKIHQAWLKEHIVGFSNLRHYECLYFDHRLIKNLPSELKERLLQFHFDSFKEATVLILEEDAIHDETLKKILPPGIKILCFKSIATSSQNALSAPAINTFAQQGIDLVNKFVPGILAAPKSPARATDAFFTPYQQFDYAPTAFNSHSLSVVLAGLIHQEGVEDVKSSLILQRLYALLVQNGKKIDHVFDLLKNDLKLMKGLNAEGICEQFTQFYGKELDMDMADIKYEANPFSGTRSYLIKRWMKRSFSTFCRVLAMPFRLLSSLDPMYIVNLGGGFAFLRIFHWIRRRLIGT